MVKTILQHYCRGSKICRMEFTSKADITPSHTNKRSYNKDGKYIVLAFIMLNQGIPASQGINTYTVFTNTLKACCNVPSSVVQLTGRAGWTLAYASGPGGMAWRNSRLTRPRQSGISGFLASGSGQFYQTSQSSPFPAPTYLEGGQARKQVLEQQQLAVVERGLKCGAESGVIQPHQLVAFWWRGEEPSPRYPGSWKVKRPPATSSPNPQGSAGSTTQLPGYNHQLNLVQFEFKTNVRSVYKLICMSV